MTPDFRGASAPMVVKPAEGTSAAATVVADATLHLLRCAQAKLDGNALSEAIALCQEVLKNQPLHFSALMILGNALLRAQRPLEALAAFERAATANPGHATPFTLSAVLRFRMAYGPPPPPAVVRSGPKVQCRRLGNDGRFGNQLLQYGFLQLYARRHGLIAECPDWIGRDVYDLSDPLPSAILPTLGEDEVDWPGLLRGSTEHAYRDIDIQGYFVGPTGHWGEVRDDFVGLYVLGRRVAPIIHRAVTRLRAMGDTVVAIHLRRGDFGSGRYWIAPVIWYLDWLREIWPGLTRPVLYVATDEPSITGQLTEFSPVRPHDLGVDIAGASFVIDHEILRAADLLAISNSTFSFTAAMLNTQARTFMRPNPDRRQLEAFQPWNSTVLLDSANPLPA